MLLTWSHAVVVEVGLKFFLVVKDLNRAHRLRDSIVDVYV